MSIKPSVDAEVAVVGGGYAGLAAALQLARACRRVLVVDAGRPRNRVAEVSHGFLGHDGQAPERIVDAAREQLLAYPSVQWLEDTVSKASGDCEAGFALDVGAGRSTCLRLILATGVHDELPAIDGLQERWGRSVFHCPYCHGYELQGGDIGVLADGAAAIHQAMLLPDWGQVTLFTRGTFVPDRSQAKALHERGVAVESQPVRCIRGSATVELADGQQLKMAGLFVTPKTRIASLLADQLGLECEEGPQGRYIRTDATKATSRAGVYACGDTAHVSGNISLAAADGAQAGIFVHQSLVFGPARANDP
jgi:thioredoxin reductase